MLSFAPASKFSFEVDGSAYVLPPYTLDVANKFQAASAAGDEAMMDLFLSLSNKRTVDAIRKLSMVQFKHLVKAWTNEGEDQSSAA